MSKSIKRTQDGGGETSDADTRDARRPKYSKFTQQELPTCKPILTPIMVISAFIFIGIVFIPMGLVSLSASRNVVEIVYRYDTDCIPSKYRSNKLEFIYSNENKTCTRKLVVPKRMERPVYIYYQLSNYHQNHRRYVGSRSDAQLLNSKDKNKVGDCNPVDWDAQHNAIVPCGLIAWSLFNDTYVLKVGNTTVDVNKTGIAWKSDREGKFGESVKPMHFQNGSVIGGAKLDPNISLNKQEDLIVWMRTAALPTFRKLYGKIDRDFEANDTITVVIHNYYNTYSFEGTKRLVISTTTWLGGKNNFLGFAYLSIGGLCLFLALGFIAVYVLRPRPLGDPSFLSWNRKPTGHSNWD